MDTTETDIATETPAADDAVASVESDHSETPVSEAAPQKGLNPVVRDRLVLPILVPVGAAVLVIATAVAISRAFLAGKDFSVAIASVLTIGLLVVTAAVSSARKMRATTSRLWVGLGLITMLLIGLIAMSHGEEEGGEAAFVEPEGEPVATINVEAINAASPLIADTTTVPAGVIELKGSGLAGHDLVFKSPPGFDGLHLTPENPDGKIELPAGDYVFWCVIAGHQAMVVDITAE